MPPLGHETVVGPGPAPPSLTSTETGSRIVRAGHKRYFFDLGSNNKGHYLRITEVPNQAASLLSCLRRAAEAVKGR